MDLKTELQLVEEAKRNLEAFNRIYDYYFDKIFAFCLNRLPMREVAEDITSQVFISAVEALPKFDTGRGYRFGTWMYRVASNKIIDYYRKKRLSTVEDFNQIVDEHTDTEAEAYRDDMQQQVVRVMVTLNPRYQEILSYRFFAELETDEIAALMKVKPKHVKVLLHRALTSFKKRYAEEYPDTETYILD